MNFVSGLISGIITIVVSLVGGILTIMIDVLVRILGYNHYLDVEGIRIGWTVVRDVGNIFLVVIFLVIAFGTVFRMKYDYRSTLPKFIIMAILANFSLMFVGFMIDVAQIIMSTFVISFQETAASVLVNGLGIQSFLDLARIKQDTTTYEVFAGGFAAIFFLIIAMLTIISLAVILIARIIMLWILAVLSPMAWILNILPNTSKYVGQWWGEFTKNLITGPVLAFFLWLAFMMVSAIDIEAKSYIINAPPPGGSDPGTAVAFTSSGFATGAIINYFIAIGLLLGGLMIAQQIGGAGSQYAQKMYKKSYGMLSSFGSNLAGLRPLARLGWSGTKLTGSWAAKKIQSGEVAPWLGGRTAPLQALRGFNLNVFEWKKNIQKGLSDNWGNLQNRARAESGLAMRRQGGRRGILYGMGTSDVAREYMTFQGFVNHLVRGRGTGRRVDQLTEVLNRERGNLNPINEEIANLDQQRQSKNDLTQLYEEHRFSRLNANTREAMRRLHENGANPYQGRATDEQVVRDGNRDLLAITNDPSRSAADRQNAQNELGERINEINGYRDYLNQNGDERSRDAQRYFGNMHLDNGDNLVNAMEILTREMQNLERISRDRGRSESERLLAQQGLADRQQQMGVLRSLGGRQNIINATYLSDAELQQSRGAAETNRQTIQNRVQEAQRAVAQESAYQPQDFEARSAFRSSVADARKRIQTSDGNELLALWQAAVANGDRSAAVGALTRASESGNLPTILKGTRNRDGNFYNVNIEGLQHFIREQLIGEGGGGLGINPEMARMIGAEVSEDAKEKKQLSLSGAYEMENGRFREVDRAAQEASWARTLSRKKAADVAQDYGPDAFSEEVFENGRYERRLTAPGLNQLWRIREEFFKNNAVQTQRETLDFLARGAAGDQYRNFLAQQMAEGQTVANLTLRGIQELLRNNLAAGRSDSLENELRRIRETFAPRRVA